MTINIEQRMFYLMLSAIDGQQFASSMGFPIPSQDVQEMEIMDVVSRWVVVATSGVLESIQEAVEWFVSFLEKNDKLNSASEEFSNALLVYSIALVNKMMDTGLVGLIVSDEMLNEMYEDDDNE